MPFLRYEFPRVQSRLGRATAEHHARELARRWIAVPVRDRFPSRLEGEAQRYGVGNEIGYCDADTPLEGSEQLAPWLYLVKAPGRCFLDVDLHRMGSEQPAAATQP